MFGGGVERGGGGGGGVDSERCGGTPVLPPRPPFPRDDGQTLRLPGTPPEEHRARNGLTPPLPLPHSPVAYLCFLQ